MKAIGAVTGSFLFRLEYTVVVSWSIVRFRDSLEAEDVSWRRERPRCRRPSFVGIGKDWRVSREEERKTKEMEWPATYIQFRCSFSY